MRIQEGWRLCLIHPSILVYFRKSLQALLKQLSHKYQLTIVFTTAELKHSFAYLRLKYWQRCPKCHLHQRALNNMDNRKKVRLRYMDKGRTEPKYLRIRLQTNAYIQFLLIYTSLINRCTDISGSFKIVLNTESSRLKLHPIINLTMSNRYFTMNVLRKIKHEDRRSNCFIFLKRET